MIKNKRERANICGINLRKRDQVLLQVQQSPGVIWSKRTAEGSTRQRCTVRMAWWIQRWLYMIMAVAFGCVPWQDRFVRIPLLWLIMASVHWPHLSCWVYRASMSWDWDSAARAPKPVYLHKMHFCVLEYHAFITIGSSLDPLLNATWACKGRQWIQSTAQLL